MRQQRNRRLRYLIPAALAALLLTMIVVVATSTGGSGGAPDSADSRDANTRKLPVYWTVRRGQTYSQIAQKTGLTVQQLLEFNPTVDPGSIVPGQRLKLRLKVPAPPRKPLGPRFWVVEEGQSFGSIAAATKKSIITLQQLNPRLKPEQLKPGNRVRLRRDATPR